MTRDKRNPPVQNSKRPARSVLAISCPNCQVPFHPFKHTAAAAAKNHWLLFCSFRCSTRYHARKRRAKLKQRPRATPAPLITYEGETFFSLKQIADRYSTVVWSIKEQLAQGSSLEACIRKLANTLESRRAISQTRKLRHERAETRRIKERGIAVTAVSPLPTVAGQVYLVTHIESGKQYVGLTVLDLASRFKLHLLAARKGLGSDKTLQAALRKEGPDAFRIESLQSCGSDQELIDAECRWINKLNTRAPNGYNVRSGGGTGGLGGRELEVGGRVYFGYSRLARAFGVNDRQLYERYTRQNWTLEQCVGLAPPPLKEGQRRGTPVTLAGRTFVSRNEACRFFKVSRGTVRTRLLKGESIEQALGVEKGVTRRAKTLVEINGVLYSSVSKAVKAGGVSRRMVENKLKRNKIPVVIRGVQYASFSEACRKLGKSFYACYDRIRMGATPEEALFPPPSQKIVVAGQGYRSIRAAAAAFGVPHKQVERRLRSGLTIEQSLGLEPKPSRAADHNRKRKKPLTRPVTLKGVAYPSVRAAAIALKIKETIVYKRISDGWTLEQAFNLEPHPSETVAAVWEFEGVRYESQSKLAAAFGMTLQKLRDRLALGWTLPEALGKVPRTYVCSRNLPKDPQTLEALPRLQRRNRIQDTARNRRGRVVPQIRLLPPSLSATYT